MIAKQFLRNIKFGKQTSSRVAKCNALIAQSTRFSFFSMSKASQNTALSFFRQNQLIWNSNRMHFSSTNDMSQLEKQIDQLNEQFDKQYEVKKYDDAQETLRQLVQLKVENGLDIGYEVQQIGHVLIRNKRIQEGLDVLYDLLGQIEQLNLNDPLLLAKIAENVSKGEMIKTNLKKATDILDKAISEVEKVVTFENPMLYDMLARCYSQRGNIYALEKEKKNDYISEYQKAKDIYEKFEELIPEQKRSYAIILQKMANALIHKNEIDLAETNIAKSKQLWMELERNEPIDPNHFSTLITFGVVELYKNRVTQGMKVINQCKVELDKKVRSDASYSNSYMATITIVAGILKSNPAAKEHLAKVKEDYDEGLKILEGSDDDGPTKILLEEYKNIREQLFN